MSQRRHLAATLLTESGTMYLAGFLALRTPGLVRFLQRLIANIFVQRAWNFQLLKRRTWYFGLL